jgi:ribokinase
LDVFVNTDLPERGKFISYPVGRKILIKDLKSDVGGGGTNTAVAFSRFGLKAGYVGKLGEDESGKKILSSLKKENVNFLGKVDKFEKTGYSIVLDSREHNRTILTYKGANNNLSLREIKPFKTKWLYFSSLLGKSFETQKLISKKLKRQRVKIAFNPSDYLIKKKDIGGILKLCEILILNKQEAQMLLKKYKIRDKDLLLGLNKLGPRIIVITDKDKKISAYDSNKKYYLKPHKVKVVERTGAGDAFASGFVAGQIVGKSIEESLKLGLEESESVIRYFGSKNNLIKRKLKR